MGKSYGKIFGHNVQSKLVWENREHVAERRIRPDGSILWLMHCPGEECSNTVWFKTFVSKNGVGCRTCKQRSKKRPFEALYNITLKNTKIGHRKLMKMSYEEFYQKMLEPNCFYCHKPVIRFRWLTQGQPGARAIQLDRLNSSLPYTVENTVTSCQLCNQAKGGWLKPEEFRLVAAVRNKDKSECLRLLECFFK